MPTILQIPRLRAIPTRRRGFTLLECALVMVIVGVGVVGMVQLLAAGSMANADSAELTTAVNLAGNINEMMQGATYSNVFSAYDNVTYNPAVDARGTAISGLSNWTQTIDVKYVNVNDVTTTLADNNVTDMARVTVDIKHNGNLIYSTSWMAINQ